LATSYKGEVKDLKLQGRFSLAILFLRRDWGGTILGGKALGVGLIESNRVSAGRGLLE